MYMTEKYFNKRLLVFAVLIMLASCVTRKYEQPGLAVKGQLYRDTASTASSDSSFVDSTSIATISYTQFIYRHVAAASY